MRNCFNSPPRHGGRYGNPLLIKVDRIINEEDQEAYFSSAKKWDLIRFYDTCMNFSFSVRLVATISWTLLFMVVAHFILIGSCFMYWITYFETALLSITHKSESKQRAYEAASRTARTLMDYGVVVLMELSRWHWHVKILVGVDQPAALDKSKAAILDDLKDGEAENWPPPNAVIRTHESPVSTRQLEITTIRGQAHLSIPRRCIVFSNHLSIIDGFVLKRALFPSQAAALIKSSVARIPFVGRALRLARHPFVYFTGENGGWRTTNKAETRRLCEETINAGVPLIVYPEGAVNMSGFPLQIAPFRRGIISFAIQKELPIVTCVIHGSNQAWAPNGCLLGFARVTLLFSNTLILPSKNNSILEIEHTVRQSMTRTLDKLA